MRGMRVQGGVREKRAAVRICVTVDPTIPVPPVLYGGIERAVDLLVRGLVSRGHDVRLFAHPDSRTAGRLHPYGVPPHDSRWARWRELLQVGWGLTQAAGEVDLVHSFGRLAALAPILPRRVPKVQSYQRAVPWAGVGRALRLARGSLTLTGCSASLFEPALASGEGTGRWRAVFNPVDTGLYDAVAAVASDAPLVFLGRVERIKGPHHAIAIARRAGRRLVIAGPAPTAGDDAEFFRREVAPHLDGGQVTCAGAVDDRAKNRLLGSAAALLMPVQWEEPFGIVMAEAMACGTPVIGYRRGSLPEVITDGVNGFCCDDMDGAVRAVGRLPEIDRRAVRVNCERRFGQDVIVNQYLSVYDEAMRKVRG
jgi:glycosyltransferase involved in cell wall biosynthesis